MKNMVAILNSHCWPLLMHKDSDFIKDLATSPDPDVYYSIIAAGLESIYDVPDFDQLDPVRVVACDHMSYFRTIVGLEALHDSLS